MRKEMTLQLFKHPHCLTKLFKLLLDKININHSIESRMQTSRNNFAL